MKTSIPVKRVVQLEIACSFCDEKLRKDSRNREEDAYGQNEDYHFGVYATDQGWLAAKSKEGYELTFCPDHVSTAKEMGLM